MASSEKSGNSLFWPALVVVGTLGAAVYFVYSRWELLRPQGASESWAAIEAAAIVITAIFTLGLILIAIRGLQSLAVAREDLRITREEIVHRADREAKLSAVQRLEEVAKEIIPQNSDLLDLVASAGIRPFLGPNDAVQFDPDRQDLKPAQDWAAKLPPGAYGSIIAFLNRLEAWCVYFTKGIADPDAAFGPIAPVLRSWVGQYYAVLLILRSGIDKSSGKYPNLVQLYVQWTAQMDREQLSRLHSDIAGQLENAEARLAQSKLPATIPNIRQ